MKLIQVRQTFKALNIVVLPEEGGDKNNILSLSLLLKFLNK
jgi:hypothetical protein